MGYLRGMAARAPRRTFATPFVVTLAAVPACYVQSSPQPQSQPVAQTDPQPTDSHPVVVSNPPRPQPQPQPPPQPQPQQPNPSAIHNPPRPQPDPAQTQPAQEPPKVVVNPPRPQSPGSWHVYKTASGCEAAVNVHCPAGAMCNPPPPKAYTCPPGIVMGKPITVVTDGSGTCIVEQAPVSCPTGAVCNPPRPKPFACPQ